MAAGPPLSHLVLKASSVADDLGYVALADVAKAIEKDESLPEPLARRDANRQLS
jgi:hypothetical protein